jgi:hypothetical protein
MTDLELVRTGEVPRPEEICRKLAARMRLTLGFVLYGILLVPVACGAGLIGLLVMLHVGEPRFDETPFPLSWRLPSYAVAFACASVPIISFAKWVKRRRRAAFALVREGDLVEVKVTQAIRSSVDGPHTSARVELPDGALAKLDFFAHTESLTEGAVNPALVLAGADVCLVFVDGDATPAKLRLSPRLRVSSSGTRGS